MIILIRAPRRVRVRVRGRVRVRIHKLFWLQLSRGQLTVQSGDNFFTDVRT